MANIVPKDKGSLAHNYDQFFTFEREELGQQIVVLDKGFVYVGDVSMNNQYVLIQNAKNLRRWGTTEGLGQLRNGPLPETKIDQCGTILAPKHSLVHFIPCRGF